MPQSKLNFVAIIIQTLVLITMLLTGYASSTEIVIIYALETVLIGLFHALKMLWINAASSAGRSVSKGEGVGLVLFFLVHYGFFIFVQTNFFFVFLSMSDDRIVDDFGFKNYIAVAKMPGVQAAGIMIFLSLIVKFFVAMRNKRLTDIDLKIFMFVPYLRIFIQQLTAILPGFFIILFDGGIVAALILIVLRTVLDLGLVYLKLHPEKINSAVDFMQKKSQEKGGGAKREDIQHFLELVVEE